MFTSRHTANESLSIVCRQSSRKKYFRSTSSETSDSYFSTLTERTRYSFMLSQVRRPMNMSSIKELECDKDPEDSGHEPNSSSSSNSLDDVRQQDMYDAGQQNPGDTFVDAIGEFELKENEKTVYNDVAGLDGLENETATKMELKERLEETGRILNMALNNKFVTALNISKVSADKELYRSLACATLSFLRAVLTLEPTDVQEALSAVNQAFDVSAKLKRGTSTASMMIRLIYRPNYNTYTDEDCHAELVHAESLLLLSLVSFISDQSIICMVKGAFRLRACYQRYKECLYILENRHEWSSDEARLHFESGVRMGHGTFNLIMSFLPRRVLRILEYVGFSGDRVVGVDELDKSIALNDGLRSVFSALILLTYYSYIENLFGLGNYDVEEVRSLNNSLEVQFPNSAFFLLFRGRFHQMQGNLEMGIENFEKAIEAQDDWKQFHSICHWEIMWCHAVQMNWTQAAHYADLLRKRSKWSAASYQYQYGTFLYAQLVEDERSGRCTLDSEEYKTRVSEIRTIIEGVPDLRIRYAGKTIPAEKFAITRSSKFCHQNNRLTLPALEFLYIWNIFVTLKNSPQQVERLLDRIDNEISYIENIIQNKEEETQAGRNLDEDEAIEEDLEGEVEDVNNWTDDLCLTLLLKGMCLKQLNRLDEAEECFTRVLNNESKIVVDTFIVPHSTMELALLKLMRKQYNSARKWIKKARNQYTGYLHETIVHFRLHAASRVIRLEQMESSFNSSTESQSNSCLSDGQHKQVEVS